VNVVEVVFCGGGEEVAELKVVEGTAVCEICVAEFVECVDLTWVVGLRREVRNGGGGGLFGEVRGSLPVVEEVVLLLVIHSLLL
jgi:hypothetical protein